MATVEQALGGGRPSGGAIGHVLVCGGGLAGWMTVAALAQQLPGNVQISFAEISGEDQGDLFYGNVTGPGSYEFNLAAGLSEPAMILGSSATFSWGSKYEHWSHGGQSWIQCFNLPLPVIDGVMLHQYLVRQGMTRLDPFLMGATAARRGAFAHPPRSDGPVGQQPLARAEYGYHVDVVELARCFAAAVPAGRVRHVTGALTDVTLGAGGIAGIRVDGVPLPAADLYVDCTGPAARLLSRLESVWTGTRTLAVSVADTPEPRLGAPVRLVAHDKRGWTAKLPLRGRVQTMTVTDADEPPANDRRRAVATLGRRHRTWVGNCVGVGHAAGIVEPITPAPIMLLEGDVARLMALIPVDPGAMTVEQREYDRQHAQDQDNALLFHRALFETPALPDSEFWRTARTPLDERLERKLQMFVERGVLVSYDHEPFHAEDWTIQHFGIGRRPRRHDRLADRADGGRIRKYLDDAARQVASAAAALPSHHDYMTQFERYLKKARA